MLILLKKLVKKIIPQSAFLQRFYLGLHYIGLWGMNYGRNAELKESGELRAIQEIRSKIGLKPIILDVGANVGSYSLALSEVFPTAQIHSLEPVKKTFKKLKDNIKSQPNIVAHQVALGDENKRSEIFINAIDTHSSMVGHRTTGSESINRETIQVKRLDDFVSEQKILKIDFLKIDVEGFEINVLRGAKELIEAKKITCIQFEFGGTMVDAHVFLKDFYELLDSKYNLYRITKSGLYPIGDYKGHHEIFHYCNYMAILKN